MKFLIGRKVEMTQHFAEDGRVLGVTKIVAGPCTVTGVRTLAKDGYDGVQVGFEPHPKGAKGLGKVIAGQVKKFKPFRILREFRTDTPVEEGQELDVRIFQPGDKVKVVAKTKGRGFQGVVKRHGFHGSPASHGHKDQLRMPGSIGATDPQRVFPGTRMGGHMGDVQVTISNIEVESIDLEENAIYLYGGVPGARGSLVMIRAEGELVIPVDEPEVEEPTEETLEAPVVEESTEEKAPETNEVAEPEDKPEAEEPKEEVKE